MPNPVCPSQRQLVPLHVLFPTRFSTPPSRTHSIQHLRASSTALVPCLAREALSSSDAASILPLQRRLANTGPDFRKIVLAGISSPIIVSASRLVSYLAQSTLLEALSGNSIQAATFETG
ncbi:hypothetical protein NDA14_002950 [Ustilago hordei]|nr:hypothetical protein NDA10_003610 [Ustilago hordei]KAJ1572054.1 hypothetical protein NDA15_003807 [Ustilago hordei]KAJ1594592.1 hypothetical protein NDA14_002950 [Ustilago hordei]